MRLLGSRPILLSLWLTASMWPLRADAIEVTQGENPVRLDVTETSVLAQHFDARDGENPSDQGYGAWLNRLNLALSVRGFTLGARLDSSVYWLRPVDRESFDR